jgi:hypothetical protein
LDHQVEVDLPVQSDHQVEVDLQEGQEIVDHKEIVEQ